MKDVKCFESFRKEMEVGGHKLIIKFEEIRFVDKYPSSLNSTPDDFIFYISIYVKNNNETFSARAWNGSLMTEGYLNNWTEQIFKEISPMLAPVLKLAVKHLSLFELFDEDYERLKAISLNEVVISDFSEIISTPIFKD